MNQKINWRKFSLTVLAFIVVSFAIQAISHFVINVEHYASVDFLRTQPIFILGIVTMLIQGSLLAYLYPLFYRGGDPAREGLRFGLIMGAFLVAYIAIVEPAKYLVPSISSWFAVESIAGLIQFSIFGVTAGLIYGKNNTKNP